MKTPHMSGPFTLLDAVRHQGVLYEALPKVRRDIFAWFPKEYGRPPAFNEVGVIDNIIRTAFDDLTVSPTPVHYAAELNDESAIIHAESAHMGDFQFSLQPRKFVPGMMAGGRDLNEVENRVLHNSKIMIKGRISTSTEDDIQTRFEAEKWYRQHPLQGGEITGIAHPVRADRADRANDTLRSTEIPYSQGLYSPRRPAMY